MIDQIQHATHHRFTADAGILKENASVELIQGEIVEMAPVGNRHASCVDRLVDLLTLLTRQQAITRVQNPVHINDYSTVEPDLMLLVRRDDFYVSDRPSSSDVLLLVEVSDTTLQYDRNMKLPIYANAGIVEVWIADLQSMQLEVFTDPFPEGYVSSQILKSGESVSL